jgi:hypothetical protein
VFRTTGVDISIIERDIDVDQVDCQPGRTRVLEPALGEERTKADSKFLGRDAPLVANDPTPGVADP